MAKGEAVGLYVPESITSEVPQEIVAWVTRELSKISQAMESGLSRKMEVLHVEPARPREGMTYVADGTDWNPGSGAGPYAYVAGAWLPMFTATTPTLIGYSDLEAGVQAMLLKSGDMIDRPTSFFDSAVWYECDGANYTVAGDPDLFAALVKTATVTFTNATDVVNWTANPLKDGDVFRFTTTGGAPAGLTVGVTYFVRDRTANTFKLAATEGGAAIDFTSDGTGVHTGVHAPWGYNEGAATFGVPDSRRRATTGRGGSSTATLGARVGAAGGAETHTLTTAELPAHAHSFNDYYQNTNVTGRADTFSGETYSMITSIGETGHTTPNNTANAGSGNAHNILGPRLVVTKLIKR